MNFNRIIWSLPFFFIALGSTLSKIPAQQSSEAKDLGKYLVVSFVSDDDPFDRAADLLVKRHRAKKIFAKADKLDSVLTVLKKHNPEYVAFVVRPEAIDINFANQILKMATSVDDDPFVDFAYGIISGRNADAAIQLVKASDPKEKKTKPTISQFGVVGKNFSRSIKQKSVWPLRKGSVPITSCLSRGATDDTRDAEFIKETIPSLDKSPILLFASHGYPNGLVGGPKANDIRDRDYQGTVALNVACYTGVTKYWFENDWKTRTVKRREVKPEESFCLQMLDNGVGAYMAYVCPRPAGPAMMGDAMLLASSGQSVGEYWRQHLNSVVLAHLLAGSDELAIKPVTDGQPIKTPMTPAKIVLAMSTGGVLFGDPAYQPFAAKPGADPRSCRVTQTRNQYRAQAKVTTTLFHFYAGEPLNYWEERSGAFRLETIVKVKEPRIREVKLSETNLGDVSYRLVAAPEKHRGQHYVRVKATFARPKMSQLRKLMKDGLSGTFEIDVIPADQDDSGKKVVRHNVTR